MENIITRYLIGKASAGEKKDLLRWLKESEENRKQFSEIYDIWILSENNVIDNNEIQEAFNIFKKNTHKENISEPRKIKLVTILQKAAAILVIVLISSAAAFWLGRKTIDIPSADSIVMNQVVMGKDSKGMIVLPDSTQVWLNANSKIIYPEVFSNKERNVEVEGEAYFNVTHDEQRRFIVQASGLKITVLGTQFDVKNYIGNETSEVILLFGKVNVETPLGDKINLSPNQKISFDRINKEYILSDVNADKYVIWTNDKLVFENEKLVSILDKLKYWYNVDIKYDANIPLNMRLSLTIRKETKEELFKSLELIAPIGCSINAYENQIFINKR